MESLEDSEEGFTEISNTSAKVPSVVDPKDDLARAISDPANWMRHLRKYIAHVRTITSSEMLFAHGMTRRRDFPPFSFSVQKERRRLSLTSVRRVVFPVSFSPAWFP